MRERGAGLACTKCERVGHALREHDLEGINVAHSLDLARGRCAGRETADAVASACGVVPVVGIVVAGAAGCAQLVSAGLAAEARIGVEIVGAGRGGGELESGGIGRAAAAVAGDAAAGTVPEVEAVLRQTRAGLTGPKRERIGYALDKIDLEGVRIADRFDAAGDRSAGRQGTRRVASAAGVVPIIGVVVVDAGRRSELVGAGLAAEARIGVEIVSAGRGGSELDGRRIGGAAAAVAGDAAAGVVPEVKTVLRQARAGLTGPKREDVSHAFDEADRKRIRIADRFDAAAG